jgi:hypothetical protein
VGKRLWVLGHVGFFLVPLAARTAAATEDGFH